MGGGRFLCHDGRSDTLDYSTFERLRYFQEFILFLYLAARIRIIPIHRSILMKFLTFTLPLIAILAFTGCMTSTSPDVAQERAAAELLKQAERKTSSVETRAGLYLESAAKAGGRAITGKTSKEDQRIYNKAAADLTVLLRSSADGKMWNRPLVLTSGGTTYRLRFDKGTRDGNWDPDYFTSFTPAAEVPSKTIKNRDRQDGIGGALVGVHQSTPPESFSPRVGVTAPVTAILDFKGTDVTLKLCDPDKNPTVLLAGAKRPLDADFSAPLAYYPAKSELWNGLMGALHVSAYMSSTGLYTLEPYDPDRIPLIFVHGLISTVQMWRNVINEVESDPSLRGRYQCAVFGYPTGNPPAYSALRLREELAKFYQLHPQARKCVLVGHSMGGLVSRMQATTVDREAWDVVGKDKAKQFFSHVKKGDLVDKATTFNANPHVGRLVFICTPHRGSELALGSLGKLGMRLISLPLDLTTTVTGSLGSALGIFTGNNKQMPNSVTGLSPTNPMLKVLDSRPIEAPYHTILGDSGKGDSPNSTDGIVKYWSSHLTTAKSEKIVPGPHGSCELPETITELRRILHLHLKENGGRSTSPSKH
jgi:pimeloyl-ACP methyl ester carboxylesterase